MWSEWAGACLFYLSPPKSYIVEILKLGNINEDES
jgi:hypothetical protein